MNIVIELMCSSVGPCLVIQGQRVAGVKPYSGCTSVFRWVVKRDVIEEAIGQGKRTRKKIKKRGDRG
jgi:hypothetical protein